MVANKFSVMLETTLPKPMPLELQMAGDLPVIKIRRHEPAGAPTTATASTQESGKPREFNFARLQQVLAGLSDSVAEAKSFADQAGKVQQDCFERAQQAESDKIRLQQELQAAQSRIQELEKRIPRLVRKIFGA
jgi:hypothetical protein